MEWKDDLDLMACLAGRERTDFPEREEPPATLSTACLASLESVVFLDRRASMDVMAFLDFLEPPATREIVEAHALLAHPEQRERRALQDILACLDLKEISAILVCQELLEIRETMDFREHPDALDHLEHLDSMAYLESPVRRENRHALNCARDAPELPASRESPASPDFKDPLDLSARRDPLACLEQMATLDRRETPARLDFLASLEERVCLACLA